GAKTGAGTAGANGTVTTNGSLSPGGDALAFTMNVQGNLNISSGQYYVTIGTTSDQIAVTGNATIGAGVALAGQGAPANATDVVQILTSGSAVASTFTPAATVTIDSRTYSVAYPAASPFGITLMGSSIIWYWHGDGVTNLWFNAVPAAR